MNTAELRQVQAARQALDEKAVKTACLILDGIIRESAPDTSRKPALPRRVDAVQPDLLVREMSQPQCTALVARWVSCQRINVVFDFNDVCRWLENESGVVLSSKDREIKPKNRRPTWHRRVSRALDALQNRGILCRTDVQGNVLPQPMRRIKRLH